MLQNKFPQGSKSKIKMKSMRGGDPCLAPTMSATNRHWPKPLNCAPLNCSNREPASDPRVQFIGDLRPEAPGSALEITDIEISCRVQSRATPASSFRFAFNCRSISRSRPARRRSFASSSGRRATWALTAPPVLIPKRAATSRCVRPA